MAVAVARVAQAASEVARARALAGLQRALPRVGVLDRGVFACDLRGTRRLLGAPRDVGVRIAALCERAGAPCAVGIAPTPFAARVLAEQGAIGAVRDTEDVPALLAPLALATLPLESRVLEDLALLGIASVGGFAALERAAVLDRFGRAAAYAHALACGEDTSGVPAVPPRRRIRARRRYDDAIASRDQLAFALRALVDEIARELAADGLAALRVSLVLEREKDGALRVLADAPLRLERLLLPATSDAAAIVRSLRWALDEWPDLGQVVGASVEATEVEPLRGRQLGLFAADGARLEEATSVAQHLRGRLGPGVVLRPRVVDADARLPERESEWSEVVA